MTCYDESLSRIQLFATPWTEARQAPLSTGILQERLQEWVAMPFSRGFSQPRDGTQVSSFAGRFFTDYPLQYSSGKSHGWRSPVGYSPWDHKELDATGQLHSLTLYQRSYQGNPRILWRVAYLSSRELWSPVPLGSDVALQGPRASSSFPAMF